MEYNIKDRIASAKEDIKLYEAGIIGGIALIGGSFILKNPLALSAGIGLTIGSAFNRLNYKLNKYNLEKLEKSLWLNNDENYCLDNEIKSNKNSIVYDSIIVGIGTIGCLIPSVILKVSSGQSISKISAYTIALSASYIPALINEIGKAKTLKKINRKAKKDI